jgi:hypothetical protein
MQKPFITVSKRRAASVRWPVLYGIVEKSYLQSTVCRRPNNVRPHGTNEPTPVSLRWPHASGYRKLPYSPLQSLRVGLVFLLAAFLTSSAAVQADDTELAEALAVIRSVGPKGEGNGPASQAAMTVSQARGDRLTTVLAAMDGMGVIAENWLRGAAEAVADRSLKATGKLPQADLEAFLFETSHQPRARRLAYEFIARVDPQASERLMPKLLDDPSLELRRDAVQRVLDRATAATETAAKLKAYQEALRFARDLDQVKVCTDQLEKLGQKVDTARHLGFILKWKLIGPFDNTEKKGYGIVYEPEKEIDYSAKYKGKLGEVTWIDHETTDGYGVVDLAVALDKHKGAVAYAVAEFEVPEAREVDFRLGCINANKVWVNGALVTANEVYHAGMSLDQYNGSAKLKAGKNIILVKVCQDEQEAGWAQRWRFQLRVTDALGGGVLNAEFGMRNGE